MLQYETLLTLGHLCKCGTGPQKYQLIKKGLLKKTSEFLGSKYAPIIESAVFCLSYLVNGDQASPVSAFYYGLIDRLRVIYS